MTVRRVVWQAPISAAGLDGAPVTVEGVALIAVGGVGWVDIGSVVWVDIGSVIWVDIGGVVHVDIGGVAGPGVPGAFHRDVLGAGVGLQGVELLEWRPAWVLGK